MIKLLNFVIQLRRHTKSMNGRVSSEWDSSILFECFYAVSLGNREYVAKLIYAELIDLRYSSFKWSLRLPIGM